MSYRNNQGSRQRSSSTVRNSVSTSPSYNRPRSLGFFSPNSNMYSPYSTSSPTKSLLSYTPSSLKSFGGYTSNYQSPYFPNGYRSNGYASLTIPAKALNSAKITPNYSTTYDNNSRDYAKSGNVRESRKTTRNGSFNRDRSVSRSRSTASGGMGSRSISLTSLSSINSEGYVSGTDRSSRSRLNSTSDIRGENGEIDYKKLYEQTLQDNDRLKDKLRKSDEELRDTKQTLEKLNTVTSKNSLSELEKRERRAMERKLSEMEEELKQLQKLKAENERLRAENRALTRVVSKLTNSANK